MLEFLADRWGKVLKTRLSGFLLHPSKQCRTNHCEQMFQVILENRIKMVAINEELFE